MSKLIFSEVDHKTKSFTITNDELSVTIGIKDNMVVVTNDKTTTTHCYLNYSAIINRAISSVFMTNTTRKNLQDYLTKKHPNLDSNHHTYVHSKIECGALKKFKMKYIKKFAEKWQVLKSFIDTKYILAYKQLCSVLGMAKATALANSRYLDVIINNESFKYVYEDLLKYNAVSYVIYHQFFNSYNRNQLKEWMNIYHELSNKETSKTTINKIVMSLPKGLSVKTIIAFLKAQHLHPITNKTMISAVAARVDILYNTEAIANDRVMALLKKTDASELKKAVRWLKPRGVNGSLRSSRKMRDIMTYLGDYPEEYHGDIFGLAKRSYRWHQDPRNFARQYSHDSVPPETPLAKVLWEVDAKALKKVKGCTITYLDQAVKLYEESAKMHHCVRTYVNKCIRGDSYIFHVEYKGEACTVELNPRGDIMQAQGTSNSKNKATEWCMKELKKYLLPIQEKKCTSESQTNTTTVAVGT